MASLRNVCYRGSLRGEVSPEGQIPTRLDIRRPQMAPSQGKEVLKNQGNGKSVFQSMIENIKYSCNGGLHIHIDHSIITVLS